VLPPTDKGRLVATIFCAAKTNPALTSKKNALPPSRQKPFFAKQKHILKAKPKKLLSKNNTLKLECNSTLQPTFNPSNNIQLIKLLYFSFHNHQ
jgi:hypothetical protein